MSTRWCAEARERGQGRLPESRWRPTYVPQPCGSRVVRSTHQCRSHTITPPRTHAPPPCHSRPPPRFTPQFPKLCCNFGAFPFVHKPKDAVSCDGFLSFPHHGSDTAPAPAAAAGGNATAVKVTWRHASVLFCGAVVPCSCGLGGFVTLWVGAAGQEPSARRVMTAQEKAALMMDLERGGMWGSRCVCECVARYCTTFDLALSPRCLTYAYPRGT